jgi:hypothetical protein
MEAQSYFGFSFFLSGFREDDTRLHSHEFLLRSTLLVSRKSSQNNQDFEPLKPTQDLEPQKEFLVITNTFLGD